MPPFFTTKTSIIRHMNLRRSFPRETGCMASCGRRLMHRPRLQPRPRTFHSPAAFFSARDGVHGVLWAPSYAPTGAAAETSNLSFPCGVLFRARRGAWRPVDAVLCTDRGGSRDLEPSGPVGPFYTQKGILFKDPLLCIKRARDGTRTRDPDLGKVVLHQLSHSRINKTNIEFSMPRTGIEPVTRGFSVLCSTN